MRLQPTAHLKHHGDSTHRKCRSDITAPSHIHVNYEGPVPKIAAASAAVGAGGVAERAATLHRDAIYGSQSGPTPVFVVAWVYLRSTRNSHSAPTRFLVHPTRSS